MFPPPLDSCAPRFLDSVIDPHPRMFREVANSAECNPMDNHNQDHPEAGPITVGLEMEPSLSPRPACFNQFIPSQLFNFSVPYSVL